MTTHEQHLANLPTVALKSHDPNTQTACILVSCEGPTIAAANRIPLHLGMSPERVAHPAKYDWIMHAERAAIARAANAGVSTYDSTMYLNWFPCAPCAQMMIEAGVRTLYAKRNAYEARCADPRYDFALAMTMLREAGVQIHWF